MTFPNFNWRRFKNASNFLDDLEMAFLVFGRDGEEVKLWAFPLVLQEEAKAWFQDLEPRRKSTWDALNRAFLLKYSNHKNLEDIWARPTALQQSTLGSYPSYEAWFLKLWAQWEESLLEGERAANFLRKERFIAGLSPSLQEKVKGKFLETFEEALQWAKLKDRQLVFRT